MANIASRYLIEVRYMYKEAGNCSDSAQTSSIYETGKCLKHVHSGHRMGIMTRLEGIDVASLGTRVALSANQVHKLQQVVDRPSEQEEIPWMQTSPSLIIDICLLHPFSQLLI
jgi:hypothetical protein